MLEEKWVGGEGIKEGLHLFISAQRELGCGWANKTGEERVRSLTGGQVVGEAMSRVAVALAVALGVALLGGSGSMFVFKARSSSEGGVVSVPEEVLRADTQASGLHGGPILGSVCWLVGVSCEVRADALVAAHLRRQSRAALLC